MVAQEFFDLLQRFHPAKNVGAEDFGDRFNYHFTVVILLISTLVVTIKQYVMKPISCYIATTPGGQNYINYVENYCWIHGTHAISITEELPMNKFAWKAREANIVGYYQWIPFVLGLQAILFYLPRTMWLVVTFNRTGTDISNIIATAMQAVTKPLADREKLIVHIAKSLEQMFYHYREHRQGYFANVRRLLHRFCYGLVVSKRLGTWLVMWYFFVKVLYLLNCGLQIYLMQKFLGLGTNYKYFGIDIARDIVNGRDWQQTMVFPRVTYCYVMLKQVANNNKLTAQCVLPVNMLNEKIYIFLWFWIVVCFIITSVSLVIWVIRISHQKSNSRFVRKYLMLAETFSRKEKPLIEKFVRQYLRHDGVFLLRMIGLNAGDLIVSEITIQLWKVYQDRFKHRDFRNDGRIDDVNGNMIRLEDAGGPSSGICIPTAPDLDNMSRSNNTCEMKMKLTSNT